MAKRKGLWRDIPVTADTLRALGDEELEDYLSILSPRQLDELLHTWEFWGRPAQLAPEGNWKILLALAGRGFGKTRMGTEWVRQQVKMGKTEIGCVAPTKGDVRAIMVEGESGLLKVCWKGDKTYRGAHMGFPVWSPTNNTMTWENGAKARFYSAEDPERLRGPNLSAAWCDELCSWNRMQETWDMLQMTLRIGKNPQIFISTTPKPSKLLIALNDRATEEPSKVVRVSGTSYDNSNNINLDALKSFEGTRLGRQELYAEILTQAAGALWTADILKKAYEPSITDTVKFAEDNLARVIVSIDPATTTNADSDMTGIIVAGVDINGVGYILEDHTDKYTPQGWASKAVSLYHKFSADRIVAEKNQGGEMVRSTLTSEDETIPIRLVHASRGKYARAEPVSALYEQGKVKHARDLDKLEQQMTAWEPLGSIGSPDRLDACLAGETSVLTTTGYSFIRDISKGDSVITRAGPKKVEWAGITRKSAKTLDITLSNGYVVKATDEHPFYVKGFGWVQAAELRSGDELVNTQEVNTWNNTRQKLSSTETLIEDTQIHQISQNKGITSLRQEEVSSLCIGPFGSFTTGQYQMDSTSTTKTVTTSTTQNTTLTACPPRIMQKNTRKSSTTCALRLCPTQELSLQSGMVQKKVSYSIGSLAKGLGITVSLSTNVLAQFATKVISLTQKAVSPVLRFAGVKGTKQSTKLLSPAQSVIKTSSRTSISLPQPHVPTSVVQVCESKEVTDVYNLHIEDQHEFIAGGVLTHNCVWAITDLMLQGTARPQLRLAYSSAKGLT